MTVNLMETDFLAHHLGATKERGWTLCPVAYVVEETVSADSEMMQVERALRHPRIEYRGLGWAVVFMGDRLNHLGLWEYGQTGSNQCNGFLSRTLWPTAEEAAAALQNSGWPQKESQSLCACDECTGTWEGDWEEDEDDDEDDDDEGDWEDEDPDPDSGHCCCDECISGSKPSEEDPG